MPADCATRPADSATASLVWPDFDVTSVLRTLSSPSVDVFTLDWANRSARNRAKTIDATLVLHVDTMEHTLSVGATIVVIMDMDNNCHRRCYGKWCNWNVRLHWHLVSLQCLGWINTPVDVSLQSVPVLYAKTFAPSQTLSRLVLASTTQYNCTLEYTNKQCISRLC